MLAVYVKEKPLGAQAGRHAQQGNSRGMAAGTASLQAPAAAVQAHDAVAEVQGSVSRLNQQPLLVGQNTGQLQIF